MSPSTSEKRVVHLVDDDEPVRAAVARLLQAAGYEVHTYGSASEFILSVNEAMTGCILLDIEMPGPNGLQLQDALNQKSCLLPVIFLTGHADVRMSVQAMKAGAVDFLTKPIQRDEVVAAVEIAMAHAERLKSQHQKMRDWSERRDRLTVREREVFERVTAGFSNKEIGQELGMAERTVKAHRAQVMFKMGAASLAELVQMAEYLRSAMG